MIKKLFPSLSLAGMLIAPATAEQEFSGAAPIFNVTVTAGATKAINYTLLDGATKIDFKGTVLLPQAHGRAKISRQDGSMTIEAKFKNMEPAGKFGSEYLTYILWAISPEGRVTNLGELVIDGGKSRLSAPVPLQTFSLIVTAEPYFAATQVSDTWG